MCHRFLVIASEIFAVEYCCPSLAGATFRLWNIRTWTPIQHLLRNVLPRACDRSSSDDTAELFAGGMSMTPGMNARDNGAAGSSADFGSVWGSPTDFDHMFGDEGMDKFLASPSTEA